MSEGISSESIAKRFDDILIENRKSRTIATWQLALTALAAIVSVAISISQSSSIVVEIVLLVFALIVLGIVAVGSDLSSSNNQWYTWIVSREKMKMYSEYMKK